MNIIRTKSLYQQVCRNSSDLHVMTNDERKQLQAHLLYMYKEIEAVCKKYNLSMMLAYGSVLGAVRHGGFIPWDDDIDLFMPRKDYELFITKYASQLPRHMKVYAPNSINKPITRFAKVVDTRTKFIEANSDDNDDPAQGIFVDIFPLDSIKQAPIRNRLSRYLCMALMYIGASVGIYEDHCVAYRRLMAYTLFTKANYWLRQCIGFLFSYVSHQRWMNIIDNFCRNDKRTGFVDELVGVYKWKPVSDDVFFPPQRGLFEGREVFLPHDAVSHLEQAYHDWKRIPPENERVQHFVRLIKFVNDK